MSIYRRLIVIGKYMEGKFIAGKSLHFIGCKSNQKNATIMTIQRHFGVMHVTKYVQNSILHQIKGLKLFKMVVNDLRKPDSVVVIQNYVKLFALEQVTIMVGITPLKKDVCGATKCFCKMFQQYTSKFAIFNVYWKKQILKHFTDFSLSINFLFLKGVFLPFYRPFTVGKLLKFTIYRQ